MNSSNNRHVNLQEIARETLLRFGFLVDLPRAAQTQLTQLREPDFASSRAKNMTNLLWSSIDNDDSRDLDQIEYIETDPRGFRLFVAIADLDSFVARLTPLDQAACHNTTSIYTGVRTYPMFPEKLSFDLTSLIENEDRLAVVTEMLYRSDGELLESNVYRAIVRNKAQLTYNAVGAWLEGVEAEPSEVSTRVIGRIESDAALQEQLRNQHQLAQALRDRRYESGALTFDTIQVRPQALEGGWELKPATRNAATRLIEDIMISTNRVTVSFLTSKSLPTLRRVVRTPKNWAQIVRLAALRGTKLPDEPESKLLEDFLCREKKKDPAGFPDLSLSVIKLLGRGEYVVALPGREAPGHFALAVEGYTHSTAPNRRYPDVVTQRLLMAAFAQGQSPYANGELTELAEHCTQKETDANKAERSVHKSVAAVAMVSHIGEKFEGMITGAADKGTWVRLMNPPVEGRLGGSVKGLGVGDRVRVELVSTDPWRGYIDFHFLAMIGAH